MTYVASHAENGHCGEWKHSRVEVGAEYGEFGEVLGEVFGCRGGPSGGEARSLGPTAAAFQYQSRQDFPVSVTPLGVQQNFITKQQNNPVSSSLRDRWRE
jgi:hypothetical protein